MQREKNAQQVISYNYNNVHAETLGLRNTMEDIKHVRDELEKDVHDLEKSEDDALSSFCRDR